MPRKDAKRKRVASSTMQPLPEVESKHKLFTEWAQARGVEINGVLPQSVRGKGLGLVTTRHIKKDERILFVPEGATFKPDFTALRLKKLDRASSQAKLAISAMLRFASKESTLKLWLATWPTVADFQNCMPIYWAPVVNKDLPYSARHTFNRQLTDYNKDCQACQSAVVDAGYQEADFKYFWMIINSRSFHWSPPSGSAGYMVMCPFIDYINHGPTGSGCNVFQRGDGFELTAERKYGEEILISYGAHPNEKLLVHYGFTLPYAIDTPIPDDEVRTDVQILPLLTDVVEQQLSDLGYRGPFALVPLFDDDKRTCGWEPCFKTQVAVRATLLTCNEWEFFAGNGEDLSGDNTEAVNKVLVDALSGLVEEAKRKIERESVSCPDMTEENFRAAQEIITSRWRQIEAACQWFIDSQRNTLQPENGI